MNTEKKKQFIINTVYYVIIVCLIVAGCKYLLPIFLPFIIAFAVASLLRVPAQKLAGDDNKLRRACTIVLGVLFFAVVFLGIAYAGVKLVDLFLGFVEFVPNIYQNELLPLLNYILEFIKDKMVISDAELLRRVESAFQTFIGNIGTAISTISMKAVRSISGGIMGIPGLVVKLVIMIISCFFFMMDYDRVIAFLVKLIPKDKEKTVKMVKWYVTNTLLVYIRSYALLFLLTYVELTIGFYLIGIPYAPIVGLLVAIFDILPILGTGGILLPWGVILLIMKKIPMGIGMFVLYLVITVIRNTLEPKLVGKQIGLHPLATLISLYVGLKVIGIIGMFIFPVTLVVLTNMQKEISGVGENLEENAEEEVLQP